MLVICYQATDRDTHVLAEEDARNSKLSEAMHAATSRILKALYSLKDESLLVAFPQDDSMKSSVPDLRAALRVAECEGRVAVASGSAVPRSAVPTSFTATPESTLPGRESLQDGNED